MSTSSKVTYRHVSEFPGWEQAPDFLRALIHHNHPQKILEIGSGANPTLSAEEVTTLGIEYTTNDISAEELKKAPKVFTRWQADLCAPNLVENHFQKYDLIFSRMVNEHVRDGKQYYQNIYSLLRPEGVTAHCFSTLFAFPFLVNKLLPEQLTDRLLNVFNPRDRHQHEKFRAYYSWSRGPARKMFTRFENLGFEILEYTGYFGHGYYRNKLPFLDQLERRKASWLVRHPSPWLTSYASLVMKKTAETY